MNSAMTEGSVLGISYPFFNMVLIWYSLLCTTAQMFSDNQARIGSGVALAITRPNHPRGLKVGKPASAKVGTLGNSGKRFAPE